MHWKLRLDSGAYWAQQCIGTYLGVISISAVRSRMDDSRFAGNLSYVVGVRTDSAVELDEEKEREVYAEAH